MVAAVGYHNRVVRPDRDAARPGEASRLAPPTPHLELLPPFLQVLVPNCGTARCETGYKKHHINYCSVYFVERF